MGENVRAYEVGTEINDEEKMIFHDVRKPPFHIYGLYDYENQDKFKRLPDEIAGCSETVEFLYKNTAGGRVRFFTDSQNIAIKVSLKMFDVTSHTSVMPLIATSGFDLYVYEGGKYIYYGIFYPPYNMVDGYEAMISFDDERPREIMINFPLRCNVNSLFVGVDKQANLKCGREYRDVLPVVYYGSSITQGACSSRPGNCYPSIISRELDIDYINLGFAGGAKGEEQMADYISGIDMSAFVFDYDYNAQTVDNLQNTHKKFFDIIRNKNPKLPVVMLSRPNFDKSIYESKMRRNVILSTYQSALDLGDKNVYFVDGETIFGNHYRDSCTVDSIHPNDYGFVRMADKVGAVLKEIFMKV